MMSMDEFFEAWVEAIFARFTRRAGGELRVGRRRETICPIVGILRTLVLRIFLCLTSCLKLENETLIIDAKFKGHWEDLQLGRWSGLDQALPVQHRSDLLQLTSSQRQRGKTISCCLVYPCTVQTWETVRDEGGLPIGQADGGHSQGGSHLTVVPMVSRRNEVPQKSRSALQERGVTVGAGGRVLPRWF